MQVASFDLSMGAPDPTHLNLSATVPGAEFQATTVRVVAATDAATTLLVGGVNALCCHGGGAATAGVLAYGSVAAGSTEFRVADHILLPSSHGGVTALSQISAQGSGFVLAATDQGVFKCASSDPRQCEC